MKYIHGLRPVAKFYDNLNNMIEEVSISHMNENEIHKLLQSKGFVLNQKN